MLRAPSVADLRDYVPAGPAVYTVGVRYRTFQRDRVQGPFA
jgi:hypothetical protein